MQTFRIFDGLARRAQERAQQLGFSANDLLVAGLHSLLDDFDDPEEIELIVVEGNPRWTAPSPRIGGYRTSGCSDPHS